jgi:hypothetical protein
VENSSTERLIRGDLGKKMAGYEPDKENAGKTLLGKGGSNNERELKAIAKETVGKDVLAKDVPYTWVDDLSYDRGSSSGRLFERNFRIARIAEVWK